MLIHSMCLMLTRHVVGNSERSGIACSIGPLIGCCRSPLTSRLGHRTTDAPIGGGRGSGCGWWVTSTLSTDPAAVGG